MSAARTAVFWSYAHDDDASDRGRITKLCEALKAEFDLLNSRPIEVFLDRSTLNWGDKWREVIDTALVDAAFIIPIVTPRYFTRPECRRELLEFYGEAASRNLTELILPILYVNVPDMHEDASDPALQIIARTQYVDWRALRLADEGSVEYRKAVNALAVRLGELLKVLTERQLAQDALDASASAEDVEEDLAGLLAHAEDLWSDWLEAVSADDIRNVQDQAVDEAFVERRKRLRASHANASAILATYQQQGQRQFPLTVEHAEYAELYLRRTMELDPVMRAAVKTGRDRPAFAPLLAELRQKISGALEIIQRQVPWTQATANWRAFISEMPFLTETWKEIDRIVSHTDALVYEANDVVLRWAQELDAVLLQEATGEDAGGGPQRATPV